MTKGLIYVTIFVFFLGSCQQSSQQQGSGENSSTRETSNSSEQEAYHGPLILVMSNGYYGFADTTGSWVISPRFGHALPFSNGVSCVNMQGVDTFSLAEPQYRFINTRGKLVLPSLQFPIPSFFHEGVGQVHLDNGAFIQFNTEGKPLSAQVKGAALFHDGLAASQNPVTMQVGFMDKKGHWVFQLDQVESVGDFSNGRAPIQKNGQFGYLNPSGDIAIPLQYENAENFSEGRAAVRLNRLWGFIDVDGHMVIPPKFEWVSHFQEGAAAVISDKAKGYIDDAGNWLFEPKKLQADVLQPFSGGLAAVKKGGMWGYIDRQGNTVIPPRFKAATPFHFDRAVVIENSEAICIDRSGNKLSLEGTPMSVYHHPDSSNIPYPLFE
jgi:hypothetical protein